MLAELALHNVSPKPHFRSWRKTDVPDSPLQNARRWDERALPIGPISDIPFVVRMKPLPSAPGAPKRCKAAFPASTGHLNLSPSLGPQSNRIGTAAVATITVRALDALNDAGVFIEGRGNSTTGRIVWRRLCNTTLSIGSIRLHAPASVAL